MLISRLPAGIPVITLITVLLATLFPGQLKPLAASGEGLAAIILSYFFAAVGELKGYTHSVCKAAAAEHPRFPMCSLLRDAFGAGANGNVRAVFHTGPCALCLQPAPNRDSPGADTGSWKSNEIHQKGCAHCQQCKRWG